MNKPLLKSKTVWGVILGTATAILTAFHINFTVPGGDPATVSAVQSLISIGFLVYGIYGRVKAEVTASKKPWYQSKTIWSIAVTVALVVLNYFHINLPIPWSTLGISQDQSTLDASNGLVTLLPSIMAIVGRIKADSGIGSSTPAPTTK